MNLQSKHLRKEKDRMSAKLSGKTVIVTGGNLGIGKAASLLFAAEGANVIIAGRREDEGKSVVDEISAAGGSAIFVRTDVSSPDDCKALVDIAVSQFGKLDAAFNNAGLGQFGTPIVDLSLDDWDRVMSVNLRGVFLCLKYQMAAMQKSGGGSIVNTSSVSGLVAVPGLAAYQSSKHGLIGLTKVAALEGATQGIRVNAICPGGTLTEMFSGWMDSNPEMKAHMLAAHPIGRFADPIEQARAALFLLSDDASYITGVSLPVDGGHVVP